MNYFLLNVLPQIATVLIGIMYIPQIIHTYKTKDVKGIALSFWVLLVMALSVNTVNAITIYTTSGIFGALVTQGVNLILAVIVFLQIAYYKKKDKKSSK